MTQKLVSNVTRGNNTKADQKLGWERLSPEAAEFPPRPERLGERRLPQDPAVSTAGRQQLLLVTSEHLNVIFFDKCVSHTSLAVPSPSVRKNVQKERFIWLTVSEDFTPSWQPRPAGAAQTIGGRNRGQRFFMWQ